MRDLFTLWCHEGVRSFVNGLPCAYPIVTIQRQELGPTWVSRVSRDERPRCSFSSRTSPSRCSRGQSGNEHSVSADFVLNLSKHPHILLFLYTNRSLHLLGIDGSVYVCGENAFDPFYFVLRSPDTDNNFATPRHAGFSAQLVTEPWGLLRPPYNCLDTREAPAAESNAQY